MMNPTGPAGHAAKKKSQCADEQILRAQADRTGHAPVRGVSQEGYQRCHLLQLADEIRRPVADRWTRPCMLQDTPAKQTASAIDAVQSMDSVADALSG